MNSLKSIKGVALTKEQQKGIYGGFDGDSCLYYCWYKNINSGEIVSKGPFSDRNGITCPYYSGYFKCTKTGKQI